MSTDKSFRNKLIESVGYDFRIGGSDDLPVEYASGFPVGQTSNMDRPAEQTLNAPQADPLKPVVTDGETTGMDADRADKSAEQGLSQQSDPIIAEVGSLLLTIGYILKGAGLVADQYDTKQILDYVNSNFQTAEAPIEGGVPPVEGAPAEEVGELTAAFGQPSGCGYIAEQKLFRESRFSNKK